MEGTSRQGGGERNSKPTHQMKRTELNKYEFLTDFFLYSGSSKNYLRNGDRLTPKNLLLSVHLEILECF